MIELTPEQRQATQAEEAPRLVDPETNTAYVLVKAEVYERLTSLRPLPANEPPNGIDPQMLRSMQAFWRDLPELLKDKKSLGRWAAYHGDTRVAIAGDDVDAYQECQWRGLLSGECYVGKIKPSQEGIPPWGTFQSDRSLYEFLDMDEGDLHPDEA